MTDKESQRLKKEEMIILDYFVELCKKHNLRYYLAFGSLLGAIRHKGFIPWDDDIDVLMPPDDYLKFLDICKKEIKDIYILQELSTEKYSNVIFAKIRKKNTCMVETHNAYFKIQKGINIDIFPLFPVPTNKKDKRIFMLKLKLSSLLVSKNNKTDKLKNKIIFALLRLIPRKITNYITMKLVYSMLKYRKSYKTYKTSVGSPETKTSWYEETMETSFEDRIYIIPKEYDKILTKVYGDYMTPPKEEDRIGHGEIILSFNEEYEELKKR